MSSNQSGLSHDYSDCRESGNEASLLVSPLVVAGIVIGLVLFLSCVTIIVGSLRKDGRLRNPHLRASYGEPGAVTPVSAATPTHCRLPPAPLQIMTHADNRGNAERLVLVQRVILKVQCPCSGDGFYIAVLTSALVL